MRRRRVRQDGGRRCARRSRRCSTASRSPCWRRRRSSRTSTSAPSQRRFAAFPVTIELLSRFRTRPEQKEVVGARRGRHGRHPHRDAPAARARTCAFRDLGLLIVDEEQRFGVAQKERIKEWKASIDVLVDVGDADPALAATCRSSGLRDLSIIETPPRDRLAIETQVVPSRRRDRARGDRGRARPRRPGLLRPQPRRVDRPRSSRRSRSCSRRRAIAVAHGQMAEGELEKAMLRSSSREADVLLATAIVENGLDIPSANTILIDRADTFGLAQLYQLRGRVGRSDKAAPTRTCSCRRDRRALGDRARSAWRRSASSATSAPGSASRRATSRSAAPATCSAASSPATSPPSGFEMYLSLLEEAIRELRGEEPLPERSVTHLPRPSTSRSRTRTSRTRTGG